MNRAGWIEELISWTVPAHPPQFNKACDIFVLVFKHR
jgi:hypothetical protein